MANLRLAEPDVGLWQVRRDEPPSACINDSEPVRITPTAKDACRNYLDQPQGASPRFSAIDNRTGG